MKQFYSLSHSTRKAAILALIAAALTAATAGAKEQAPKRIVETKVCFVVVRFETTADGSTRITKQWSCESNSDSTPKAGSSRPAEKEVK